MAWKGDQLGSFFRYSQPRFDTQSEGLNAIIKSRGIVSFSLKGHEKESLSIMSTYLPKESGSPSIYSDGGALFALGQCF